MTDQQAQAEAQKIVQEFYEQIPEKVFETSLNYDTLHELSKRNALHHIKRTIRLVDSMECGYNQRAKKSYESILKAIEELK